MDSTEPYTPSTVESPSGGGGRGGGEENSLFSIPFTVVTGVVVCCLFLAAACGNSIVIVTMCRTWHFTQTKTSNSLVFLLAVTDLSNAVLVLPFVMLSVANRGRWVLGDVMCQVTGFVYVFLTTTTNNILSMISLNRYQVVLKPNIHESVARRRSLRMGLYSLGMGVLVAASVVIPWGQIGFTSGCDVMCVPVWRDTGASVSNLVFVSVCAVLLPLVTMLATYFRILAIVKFRSRKVTPINAAAGGSGNCNSAGEVVLSISSPGNQQARRGTLLADRRWSIIPNRFLLVVPAETMEVRTVLTLLIVIGIFCVCWIPSVVVMSVRAFDGYVPPAVYTIAVLLTLVNSAANPIVYSFRSPAFRQEVTELFRCAPAQGRRT